MANNMQILSRSMLTHQGTTILEPTILPATILPPSLGHVLFVISVNAQATPKISVTSYMNILRDQTQITSLTKERELWLHGAPEINSSRHEELESLEGNCNSNVNLIKEQYGQLASLLQHFHSRNGRDTSSIPNGAVNFAGIIACSAFDLSLDFSLLSCKYFTPSADIRILRSFQASNHITFNKSFLSDIRTVPYPLLINLPNGYRVKVTEIGTVTLAPQIILHRFLLFLHSTTI